MLQVTANLKVRLQKVEADLQLAHSKQQHMQLQLDSATAESSPLVEELESAMHSNAHLESECKAEREQCIQAKSDCAQLKAELQSAVRHQEALQRIVRELQAALETVKDQTQRSPSPSYTAHTVEAGSMHGAMHTQQMQAQRPSSSAYDSAAEASPSVIAALQQQVLELRAISAHFDQYEQQAQSQRLDLSHSSRQQAGQSTPPLQQGFVDRTSSLHQHQHQHLSFRHSCRSLHGQAPRQGSPSQSACQSPASCSQVHETIRAHHGLQHSTDHKCWCGRPKRGGASVLSTPVRQGLSDAVHAVKPPRTALPVYSSSLARPYDR